MKNYTASLFMLFLFSVHGFTQDKVKFGEINPEAVQMTVYEKDPEASALVLYESMDTRYDIVNNDMYVINNYFVRIKILTNDGLDYANQSISNYIGKTRANSDVLSGLSGNTYNWENGKVVKIKLSKEHIFEEKVSENKMLTKFTFQSVKPGSVIEYKYEITSPHYTVLNDFIFQRSIPVQYSRYQLLIPEYFRFSKETKGMIPIQSSIKEENQIFVVSQGRINCTSQNLLFEATDLPGLKNESYVWCPKDFMARVTFELRGIEIPGSLYKNYSNTWDTVDEQLLDYGDFGKQFNHKLFKEELASVVKPDMSQENKVRAIYNLVRSKVKWNDENTLWAKNPKDALKKGLGTSGEINAILISALREAGFDAYPVVMSLRYRGRIPLTHPTIDYLNYFVVGVTLENNPVYLDASAKYGNLNVLPPSCMTDFARSVRGKNLSGWIDLSQINKSRKIVNLDIRFNEEGILSGNVKEVVNGEMKYAFLSKFDDYKDQEKYIEERQTEDNIQISDLNITGKEGDSERCLIDFKFTRNEVSTQEDIIYFNPLLVPIFKENPFKEEERKLPVEFSYPYSLQINARITLPSGYMVEELPEPKKLTLNENEASFSYISQYNETDHTISINVRASLEKIIYTPTEYSHLRDYFAILATTNNTQIVLKKK